VVLVVTRIGTLRIEWVKRDVSIRGVSRAEKARIVAVQHLETMPNLCQPEVGVGRITGNTMLGQPGRMVQDFGK